MTVPIETSYLDDLAKYKRLSSFSKDDIKKSIIKIYGEYTYLLDIIELLGKDKFCELVYLLNGRELFMPTVQNILGEMSD